VHNIANIVHRDIKPENILVNEKDDVKLSDFGVSLIIEKQQTDDLEITNNAGTQAYLAPEGWTSTLTFNQSGRFKPKPLDIWATGVTLYMILFGKLPFHSLN
jgi:[calcium/calmodulin-dependent protein kinase] kinase